MKNYKRIAAIVLFVAVCVSIYFYNDSNADAAETEHPNEENINVMDVKTVEGNCSDSEYIIDEFLRVTQGGEIATIKIEYELDVNKDSLNSYGNIQIANKVYDAKDIIFDGDGYALPSEGSTTHYAYFYKVSGTLPNAATKQTQYILANEKYTFAQIGKSVFSSNSRDQVEHVMVCWSAR
jgi:hypothetical protein